MFIKLHLLCILNGSWAEENHVLCLCIPFPFCHGGAIRSFWYRGVSCSRFYWFCQDFPGDMRLAGRRRCGETERRLCSIAPRCLRSIWYRGESGLAAFLAWFCQGFPGDMRLAGRRRRGETERRRWPRQSGGGGRDRRRRWPRQAAAFASRSKYVE